MKILVTGAAGFIGSHVADAYINAGHEVTIVDNLSTGRMENVNPKTRFRKIDLRSSELTEVFRDGGFEVVNHHAAQMDVRKSVEDPIYDAEVNALGTINLLQQCIKNGVKKFIFASTGGAVYGEQDYFPADEAHPNRPLCPYGITKLMGEKYLFYYQAVHGLENVILRYSNVYGPRQNPHGEAGVVAIFTTRLLAGQQPIINGDGKQTRDYVYVGDVVRANVLALNFNSSDCFNIGTGTESDVNEIFQKLNTITGAQMPEKHGLPKEGEQRRSLLSYAKAKKILGWQPEVDLEEGLRRTVEFFCKQH